MHSKGLFFTIFLQMKDQNSSKLTPSNLFKTGFELRPQVFAQNSDTKKRCDTIIRNFQKVDKRAGRNLENFSIKEDLENLIFELTAKKAQRAKMLKIQILLQRDHVNGKLLRLPKVEVVCQTVTCKFIKYSSRRDFTKISGRVKKIWRLSVQPRG